ncbi:MAG: response regulator [Candidatus Kapabacteria bacterium]|nr:response regulator [Candidatus Kapabacteria bacterium]
MFDKTLPICVIEDNMPIRRLFCTILKKSGFITQDFADGNSAVNYLRENPVLAVICDIFLPDVSGTDILGILRMMSGGVEIPIIAVTGFAQTNDKEKFIEMGFDYYIAKPINTSTFVSDIIGVIERKRG